MKFLVVMLCIAIGDETRGAGDAQKTNVVATVGHFSITAQDLLDSYEVGPAFVKRYPDPLRKHLEYMIFERLLALEAERKGYDTSLFVRARVAALEEDLTVEELYKDDVLSRVTVSNKEIEDGIRKERLSVHIRWLYAANKGEAKVLESELKRGVSFDSVYAVNCGKDSSDRSLETTLLRLEQNTPELARSVAQLKTGRVSAPVEGPDGYYIVKLDRVWQNPLVTETENARLKGDVVRTLTASRADQLASAYVKGRMTGANPVIKAEGFNIIRALIADRGLTHDTRVQWEIPSTFMTEAGPRPIAYSQELMNRPLVAFDKRALTVGDYATWFDIRQFQLKTR